MENIPVLVAVGLTGPWPKPVLGLQMGDNESASSWRELFKDLKRRELDRSKIHLGIMDGLPGPENVFKEEFPNGGDRRCQIHAARNVLAKVPKKLKETMADDEYP